MLSSHFVFPLDDRVTLATDGASGIGLATLRMALAGGAKVVTVDVNQDALSALRGSAGSFSDRLMVEMMDVTDAGAIEATLTKARDTFGVVDGLVCCAGVSIEAPLMEVTPELWRRHIDLGRAAFCRRRRAFRFSPRANLHG
jgi:NAD(P)-dependent dehydrogenase (short-subunit alcohol dehydrogenase family)